MAVAVVCDEAVGQVSVSGFTNYVFEPNEKKTIMRYKQFILSLSILLTVAL